jgi:hypothetical protein
LLHGDTINEVGFRVIRVASSPTKTPKVPDFSNLLKPVLKPGKEYSYIKKFIPKEKFFMKNTLLQLGTKISRQHIQLILTLIALVLLVLGVGAPMDGGGISS